MQIQPYLFYEGCCEAALDFYRAALGAEVLMLMRYKENPEPPQPGCMAPGSEEKVMHASFRIGETTLMASDGMCTGTANFKGFVLSIAAASEAEVDRLFNALAQGGTVQMAPAKTFWSPRFGMVTDRYGVAWMVSVMP